MPVPPDDLVVMARIAAPLGVKGWLRVQPFSELDDALADFPEWWLHRGSEWVVCKVEAFQPHGKQMAAKLAGIEDRDAAFALRGTEVAIPRSSLPKAGENEYYWSDLIGLEVRDLQNQHLGHVREMLAAGAHDVMVVSSAEAQDILIPFVGAIVHDVDMQAGWLSVDWQADY